MSTVNLTIAAPVATLTLDRPDARNALSIALLEALVRELGELRARLEREPGKDIRVLILTGAGRSFCAGMDLKEVTADPGAPLRLLTLLADAAMSLRALPIPSIAMVNGAAIGGGCGLCAVCDFALTHADSKMGFPEVDLGVCPAVVAPWLVRRIGAGRARAMLLRGGLMSGKEALAAGLVSECVETLEGLAPATQALAEKLAAGGPRAVEATKRLLNELDGSLDAALARRSAEVSARVLGAPEALAALRARAKS